MRARRSAAGYGGGYLTLRHRNGALIALPPPRDSVRPILHLVILLLISVSMTPLVEQSHQFTDSKSIDGDDSTDDAIHSDSPLPESTSSSRQSKQRTAPSTAPAKPAVIWDEADTNGWSQASRGSNEINRIIIHVTQGSYSGAISWFNNPDAQVAAHYVINNHDAPYSSNLNYPDGEITQMVADEDIGYHDANANTNSIGIEHSAYIDPNNGYQVDGGFSAQMYEKSATLVAWLTYEYDIPVNRKFIVGHDEDEHFGGTSSHQDPGPDWNWTYYLDLVREYRGWASELPLDRVVEITVETPLARTPTGQETGKTAHIGEKYHVTGYCLCQPWGLVKIQFNSSESVWIPISSINQLASATLFEVSLADPYDWLNVRDSPSGNDVGNIFVGQSFAAVNSGSWGEYFFDGRPTAFSHSDYLVERNWMAPELVAAPPVDSPQNESAHNETVSWGFNLTSEVTNYLRKFHFELKDPEGEVRMVRGNLNSTAEIGIFQESYKLDKAGNWTWQLSFFDPLGIEQIPKTGLIQVQEEVVTSLGCTNESALNYDANATVDDGSCVFPPPVVPGCTNESALNYDANATIDDGSCEFSDSVVEPIVGCTYSDALNYDENATEDDGSCLFDGDDSEDEVPDVQLFGCTYPTALNYDVEATDDDGSCRFAPAESADAGDAGAGEGGADLDGDGLADGQSDGLKARVLAVGFAALLILFSLTTILLFTSRKPD